MPSPTVTCKAEGTCFDANELEAIIDIPPKEVLQDSEKVNMLSTFVLMFSIHAAPKEKLKQNLSMVRFKAFKQKHADTDDDHISPVDGLVQEEEDLAHPCVMDFLTSSDLAYTWWQYINSHKDWERKLKLINEGDGKDKYKTLTRFTSCKKEAVSKEGIDLYDKLFKWFRTLKYLGRDEDADYMSFRNHCNEDAVKRGIIKHWNTPRKTKKKLSEVVTPEEESGPILFDTQDLDDVNAFAMSAVAQV